jgi:alpha-amylase
MLSHSERLSWCVGLALSSVLMATPSLAGVSDVSESGVFVHMFEWRWNDLAIECEGPLRDKGYAGVQVSPPQESVPGSEWYRRYQPRSYNVNGRSGSEAEFRSMVARCNAAGVKVYVDAVINHMSAESANGFAIDYPSVPYSGRLDFHNFRCSGINYQDRSQVQNCDLVGLNDLKTETDYVRGRIADYMNKLISWGVAGFRIDAAKHIPAGDIGAILGRLNGNPYVYQEVLGAPGEAVQASEYLGNADSYETGYQFNVSLAFHNAGAGLGGLQNLTSGLIPGNRAVVFTDTHDTPRDDSVENDLTYKDGARYVLANVFMLAHPYGYPKVMSGYKFSNRDAGPPAQGANSGDSCFSGNWQCDHRTRAIANMVQFRKTTAGQDITHWSNINNQAISFGRGNRGFVVINKNVGSISPLLNTGLPNGVYCDVANGTCNDGQCSGPTLTVNNGQAQFNVAGLTAAAIHVDAMVSQGGGQQPQPGDGTVNITFQCNNGITVFGQSVYVVGSIPTLGSWAPANAVKLDPTAYPTWTGRIAVPQSNTAFEWKCLKRNEANPGAGIQWQPGSNNSTVPDAAKSVVAGF